MLPLGIMIWLGKLGIWFWMVVVLIGGVSGILYFFHAPLGQVACTQEAKQCSDGSYVGRTGPNCEFAACPTATSSQDDTGMFQGKMVIGPICPVEQVGHPCNPTPQMYAAHQVFVYSSDRLRLIRTLTPDAQGNYSTVLPADNYLVDVQHKGIEAIKGAPVTVTVVAGQTAQISIDIDTGIR